MYIASQILVCLADLIFIISMLTKKKIQLVLFLLISDILFSIHFFLLPGGITGAGTILVDVVYLLINFFLEKYNKTKYNLPLSICSIIAIIVISGVTWQGYISIFPMLSMVSYFISMMFPSVIISKLGGFTRNGFNIVYMLLIKSYLGFGLGIVLMISSLVGMILNIKQKKDKEKKANLNSNITNTDINVDIENNIENKRLNDNKE